MTKMLIDRSTVEQALEALTSDPNAVVEVSEGRWKLKSHLAIAALRAALAEPVQAKSDHETRAEIAEQQVVQLAEERDHYRNLWLKAKQAEPVEPVAWECKAGGLRRLTQRQYEAQPDNIKRHYTRIEPVQEPVAWMVYTLDGKSVCVTDNPADFTDQHEALPLYTMGGQR